MNFLDRIDWFKHDGVNLAMINDFVRNQFYDRILARYVQDQDCTDIGFGTGLLSMLALKHGARHIRAFEADPDRYALGCEIIQQLQLQHRIELINERYDNTYQPTPITFTETVNGNLWWEGLWNSLPRDEKSIFLPGEYFLELWAVTVPHSFAQGLCRPGATQQYFAPGVDIDPGFQQVVNQFRGVANPGDLPLPQGIVRFERQQETDWGWIPYMRAAQAGSPVATYHVQHHRDNIDQLTLNVPTSQWRNQTVLIVPRMGMKQDNDILYLDTGHWGPGEDPILLVKSGSALVVTHNVRNGLITYSLET
jgi:16S rRNA G966 N2-methylase RsmD